MSTATRIFDITDSQMERKRFKVQRRLRNVYFTVDVSKRYKCKRTRDEARAVRGTDTRATVTNGLVCMREPGSKHSHAQVMLNSPR